MNDIDEYEKHLITLIENEKDIFKKRIAPMKAELIRLSYLRPSKPMSLDFVSFADEPLAELVDAFHGIEVRK